MRKLILAGLLAATLPAVAHAEAHPSKSLLTMTPDRVRAATTVRDDPLEHHADFSTRKAHRQGWALFSRDAHDNHLRAIVDKRTGHTRYEVRTEVRYYGAQRDYRSAHYATAAGLQKADLTLTRHGEERCATNDFNFNCALTKTIAFELDEGVVRAIAASRDPSWAFKLKDDTGSDIQSAIVPAEAAGLLQAVDAYRSERTPVMLSTAEAARNAG